MIIYLIVGAILGLIAWRVTIRFDGESYGGGYGKPHKTFRRMGWAGFAVGMVSIVLLGSIAGAVGERWAKDNQLTYNEFLNGYETEAIQLTQPCERDGGCKRNYDCDPYEVAVQNSSTDSKGNTTYYTTYETHYHSCPYATEEWTFVIKTSLKQDFTISADGFATNPQQYRGDRGIPGGIQIGVPEFWAQAKARIDSGNPGPVTVQSTYKNYILASQSSILRKFSGAMEDFKTKNMLPGLSTSTPGYGITAPYVGTKTYFVQGLPNQDQWRAAVNQFDSALGTDLQGDMHVVFVPKDTDKDQYKGALTAYWTGPEMEKNGLSKNGIVLVIGTDGKTSSWVKAFTGMPGGNEAMLTELESLKNLDLSDPAKLLGTPKGIINGEKKVKEIVHTQGQIESIVWGANKFQRVCMVCETAGDKGQGFAYLDADIEPTTGQVYTILFVSALLFALMWGGVAWAQIPSPNLGTTKKKGH